MRGPGFSIQHLSAAQKPCSSESIADLLARCRVTRSESDLLRNDHDRLIRARMDLARQCNRRHMGAENRLEAGDGNGS